MLRARKIGVYLVLVAVLAAALALAFPDFWTDCAVSAVTGKQTMRYTRLSANEEGLVYAAGQKDGVWRLAAGQEGKREWSRSLDRLGMTDVAAVDGLFVCADGSAVLSVYEQREELFCRAYYLPRGAKTAQLLFQAECETGSAEDVQIFGFAESGSGLAFLVRQGDNTKPYAYTPGEESAKEVVISASVEKLLLAGLTAAAPEGVTALKAWQGAEGVLLLDGAEGGLWHVNEDGAVSLPVLEELTDVIALSPIGEGGVAVLTGGGELLLWEEVVVREESAMLYRPQWVSILILAGAALGVLLLALVIWLILFEVRKMQISLILRKGAVAAVALALVTAGVAQWVVAPWFRDRAASEAEGYLRAGALAVDPMDDLLGEGWAYSEELTTRAQFIYALWRAFGSPDMPLEHSFSDVDPGSDYMTAVEWALKYHITSGIGEGRFGPDDVLTPEQAFIFLYRAMEYIGHEGLILVEEDGKLYRKDEDGGKTALSALLLGDDYRLGAERALEQGEAFVQYEVNGTPYYVLFSRTDTGRLSAVSVAGESYLDHAEQGARTVSLLLWAMAAVALVVVLAVLTALRASLRRVTAGMDAIHAGKAHVEVVDRRGDEIDAMADSLNTLARDLRRAGEEDARRGNVYTRFLPNQILDLLGVSSVEELDKETFACREMTTMHVSFSFEEKVYESRSNELFDNINEVTERASRVVSAQGGTIFSFSHEGFDALFPADSAASVSAAVAIRQEIIAVNRARSRRELSPVKLHIALDTGQVMLGVVGDESRMQATTVSSSFNTNRMLTALFSKFEASILCTEPIQRLAEGYGSRYIGKTRDGAELIRVYELYDGDPHLVRQGKGETAARFADGVYTLYAGDYAAAKRIFMEIARENSGDGVARFYLYLADRFEKEPPDQVCLDY